MSTEQRSALAWLPLLQETLAKEGSFRWRVEGESMLPTLPPGSEVEIVPLPSDVPLGSLLVFALHNTLIIHRFVRRTEHYWIMQGDGRLTPDRPLLPVQVLGIVRVAYYEGEPCWPLRGERMKAGSWILRYHGLRLMRAVKRLLRVP